MKFKFDKKDILIFIFCCLILLYFCGIVITNMSEFLNETNNYSFFPVTAFNKENLVYTLLLYFGIIAVIIVSLSKYAEDKDKDSIFSILFKKKDVENYSRWATTKETKTGKALVKINIKRDKINAAGIALLNNGTEMYVDNGEYHSLIIGSTGSGKTECVVKPLVNLLSRNGESMIISDPKGELYKYTGEFLKQQGYKIVILDFREPEKGNAWNPLSLPYQYYKEGNTDKAIELLRDVSYNILYSKSQAKDPFWEQSSADYFSGLALGLFEDGKENEININSINVMSSQGDERRGPKTYAQEYFNLKGPASVPYILASNTVDSPTETRGGIISTFKQKISIFSLQQSLSEMLSHSDFDMRDLGKEKTAVFMIIHDEKKTYHSLMTIFVKQVYETLIDCAAKNGGKLERRTNFILDEFANMPPLNDVDSMVSAARSRDIRFTFIIQDFAQLDGVYGPEVAQTIRSNCGNLVYLISTEMKALEEISKMCGEKKSGDKEKTASTPLVTVSDLQKLKLFEAVIIRIREHPYITSLTPNFKMHWETHKGEAVIPNREKYQYNIFDIKSFVNEKLKDNTLNNNPMGGSPMGGGFNSFMSSGASQNPFVQSSPRPMSNPFGNMTSDDLDKMIKDIEKKLEDLEEDDDEDETPEVSPIKENKPATGELKNILEKLDSEEEFIDDDLSKTQEISAKDKPIINVDKDSTVLNNSVVSDDEFLDDFFDGGNK